MEKKVCAILLAGGSGRRMNMDVTKQRLSVGGLSVMKRTLIAFDLCESISDIILVCREDETEFAKKEAEGISKLRKIVNGGKNRLVSAKNGFLAIDFDTDLVAIHDVARCMITPEMITNVVKDAIKFGAASASSLVVDTVKRIDDEGFIVGTENRSELRLAGTPQIFCKESYGRAILSADEDDLTLTDDNSLMERVGTRIF